MKRKGFTLVELLVVIAIIVALAALSAPAILKQRKKADMIQATNNAKQVYYTLVEFDGDQGSFPSQETLDDLGNDVSGLGTDDANGLLAQLLLAGYIDSEQIFFAKGGSAVNKKPDDQFQTPAEALEPGENGFGYVMIGDEALSTSGKSGQVVLAAPLDPANGAQGVFDPDPYDNKAVILRLDGSVKSERINKSDKKVNVSGNELMETGPDTVWGETTNGNPQFMLPAGR